MNALKGLLVVIALILIVAILVLVPLGIYHYVVGGEPEMEDFDDHARVYERVAEAATAYYESIETDEWLTLLRQGDKLTLQSGEEIPLTEEQRKAVGEMSGRFSYLWVTEDYVILWGDETKKYGLLYADSPLSVIGDLREEWHFGMEYHRLNGDWYEIGNWGM
ncbi:MAG: hypothetical protein IJX82_00985 [Clostridia bacterium]|nr:hypothetical protein [Clostridia bacterium]